MMIICNKIYLYKAVMRVLMWVCPTDLKQGLENFPQLYHAVLNDEIIINMILTFFKSVK